MEHAHAPNDLLVVYVGGTIGGSAKHGTVYHDRSDKRFAQLVRDHLPRWARGFRWRIESPFKRLSEQMTPRHWLDLAQLAHTAIESGARGIVIAHGTDTLAYSAAALTVMLHNVPIPIVLTGSNVPIDAPDSDAPQNLAHALFLASRPQFRGVFVSFAGSRQGASVVMSGTNVRKSAGRSDCFQPAFGLPLARIAPSRIARDLLPPHIFTRLDPQRERPRGPYTARIDLRSAVSFFQIYPGFDRYWIQTAVERQTRAILLSAYGVGTMCTEGHYSVVPAIESAITSNVPVFIVSQHYGYIDLERYGTSELLERIGCIGLREMTPEAALVKLMWASKIASCADEIKRIMSTPLPGEPNYGLDQ